MPILHPLLTLPEPCLPRVFECVTAGRQVEALRGELEEAHRAALAAEHRAETEAASAERQRAAAEELTVELDRVQVRRL